MVALRTGALLVFMLMVSGAHSAVALITVGDDTNCDFRTSVSSNALQAAVDAVPETVPEGDLYVIHVARTGTYNGLTVDSVDREFLMEGGYADCASGTPGSTNTEIDGAGTSDAIISIDNTATRKDITLRGLTIQNASGNVATALRIRNANVNLSDVVLQDVTGAIRGGGVDIRGDALGARLTASDTQIINNTVSQEGGGIYCSSGGRLEIFSNVAISGNEAMSGGGVYVNGCNGFLNSGLSGFPGLFFNLGSNTASFGGGGLYLDSSLGSTVFTVGQGLGPNDPRPLITLNSAGAQGGAIMAIGDSTLLTVRNTAIVNNESGSLAGAIQVRNGAEVYVEQTLDRCETNTECMTINDNTASLGGAFAVSGTDSRLEVSRAFVRDNAASSNGSAVFMQNGGAFARLENVLIEGNSGASVVYGSSPSSAAPLDTRIEFFQSTIADNSGASRVIELHEDGFALLYHTIVRDTVPVVAFSGSNQVLTLCSYLHETSSIGSVDSATRTSSSPGFIDAANDNFQLAFNAEAADMCAADARFENVDIQGSPRPFDIPTWTNIQGPFDAGAYEANDLFFSDGFES